MSDLNSVIAKLTDRKEMELVASIEEVTAKMRPEARLKRNALKHGNMPDHIKKACKLLEKQKTALDNQMCRIEDKLKKHYTKYGQQGPFRS